MTAFAVLNIQSTLSLVAFSVIAAWYVLPRLTPQPREKAIELLLWVHVFRYAPLTLYAPGQVDTRIPADVAAVVAYGDFVSSLVALGALFALRARWRSAIGLVWLFTAVGVGDLALATWKAVGAQMYTFYMGWKWYILNFYVPMLVVDHALIVYFLTHQRGSVPRRCEKSASTGSHQRSELEQPQNEPGLHPVHGRPPTILAQQSAMNCAASVPMRDVWFELHHAPASADHTKHEPNRQQRDTEHGAGQIEVMTNAVRFAPSHPWKWVKGFTDVGEDDHQQTRRTEKL